MEIDKKKNQLMNEYESRNKNEIDEFVEKINEMRINLENERRKELDRLMTKYKRIKNQLSSIQKSEKKRIKNMKNYKLTQMLDTKNNDHTFFKEASTKNKYNTTKKKIIMHKINRLNQKKKI